MKNLCVLLVVYTNADDFNFLLSKISFVLIFFKNVAIGTILHDKE